MTTFTTRHMFRVMYHYARVQQRQTPIWSAWELAEDACESLTHNFGYDMVDIGRMLKASDAVLWAVHWRFKAPLRVLRASQSERRYAIDSVWNGTGYDMVTTHPGPLLPG